MVKLEGEILHRHKPPRGNLVQQKLSHKGLLPIVVHMSDGVVK